MRSGATVASVGYFLSHVLGHSSHAVGDGVAFRHLSAATLASLPVDAIVVATDGTTGSLERVRTTLERDFPFQGTPVAIDALDPSTARLLAMIQDMTDVIIVASLIIAACSLAVNIAAVWASGSARSACSGSPAFPSAFFVGSSHSRVRCRFSSSLPCRLWSAW